VAESLDTQVLRADFEVECPGCEYPLWVTGAEIIAQAAVTCPCCRARAWLVDAGGSFQNAGRDIERQIDEALKGLWR
jgi:hypothetical protein